MCVDMYEFCRGLPIKGKQMVWQYLRTLAGMPVTLTGKPTTEMKKTTLVFASASTWGALKAIKMKYTFVHTYIHTYIHTVATMGHISTGVVRS